MFSRFCLGSNLRPLLFLLKALFSPEVLSWHPGLTLEIRLFHWNCDIQSLVLHLEIKLFLVKLVWYLACRLFRSLLFSKNFWKMGFQSPERFHGASLLRNPGNHGPASWACLTKRTNLTKNNLERKWSLQDTFEFSKFILLKAELDIHSSETVEIKRKAYCNWYFEAFKHYRKSKIASLQSKTLRLIEANKDERKTKYLWKPPIPLPGFSASSSAARAIVLPLKTSPHTFLLWTYQNLSFQN